MLNHIVIMGRLTRDPELRTTQGGVNVASFSVAVERDFGSRDGGERQTDFIDCVAWRQTGDIRAAATAKFRPVLMSCAAALVGMLPMALGGGLGSELRQSMGIGSVGGILVSTIVSLYFIPALCACLKPRCWRR